ncbi:probable inactive histone-lysine N-methyltransferase SUVR2 isoform X2 [Malania oleifera]|uniref:probable inactive histone-lysine N-methyltransferase SUVR2 isoform X2 n=1 Tax=Malania oleifera TaxID=397392 RepID=UPI0025ADBE32|nr:probable inactive histone-lysine N-methyltransferase SUVR2 isoform X2 [Malania oleifera]XP_057965047.1 probable inactive histone-lysine N-methyltransferase SUVR2 isoform X2 [Malania oleifera]
MAPNPRVVSAFRAMKDLGIAEETVKPVLKNLLKLYDKNWELIEEESYRVLADAIFEYEETKAAALKNSKKTDQEENLEEEAQMHDEPERPLKRLRLRYQDGQVSSPIGNSGPSLAETSFRKPKAEEAEQPDTSSRQQLQGRRESPEPNVRNIGVQPQPVSPQPHLRNKGKQPVSPKLLAVQQDSDTSQQCAGGGTQSCASKRTEPDLLSSQTRLKDKGKEPVSSQISPREKRLTSERSHHALQFKEPKHEPGIVLLPKQKMPDICALIKPKDEPFTDEMAQYEVPIAVIHPEPLSNGAPIGNDSNEREDGPEPQETECVDGQDRGDGIPASSDEMRTSSKIADASEGSPTNLEIASSSLGEERSVNIAPSVDLLKKSAARDARSTRCDKENFSMPFCPVNGSVNISPAVIAVPQVLRLAPPLNGTADAMQLGKKITDNGCGAKSKEKEHTNIESASSRTLVVVQHHQLNPDDIRSLHDVNDITKGEERVKVSWVNEINNEPLPYFHYIPQNLVFQNAYLNICLVRIGDGECCSTCFGDCLSSNAPCACACKFGGEFAYTLGGLVKEEFLEESVSVNIDPQQHCLFYCKDCPLEKFKSDDIAEPCKGHLMRKFIKECWSKCGCRKQCGNRLVQRGITCDLQVFFTPDGKGWGLRTLEDLPKGAFVCEYVGEILTNTELHERNRSSNNEKHRYAVVLDAGWQSGVIKDEEALCLDAGAYGNVARFINHRCLDANLIQIPVEVETPDHHYYRLAFFTARKVNALEELTWDYGVDFDDHDHPIKAFRCLCGSKFCRSMNRTNRSRSTAIVK